MATLHTDAILDKQLFNGNEIEEITTLVVTSRSLIHKGLVGQLNNELEIKPPQHVSNKLDMVLRIQGYNPSLVIINDDTIDSDHLNTLKTIRMALNEFPSIKILLIISSYDIDFELLALKEGVRGIIVEDFEQNTLIECIKTIANGGLWIRKTVMEDFITQHRYLKKHSGNNAPSLPSFTKRELQIIQLVVNGHKNKEIGEQLFISEKTVKHHLTKIFRKLNIHKRVQLKGII
jgi:two-component system, NarL family, response regulator DegU